MISIRVIVSNLYHKKIRIIFLHIGMWILTILITWGIYFLMKVSISYTKVILIIFPFGILFYINYSVFEIFRKKEKAYNYLVPLLMIGVFTPVYITILYKSRYEIFKPPNIDYYFYHTITTGFLFSILSVLSFHIEKLVYKEERLKSIFTEKLEYEYNLLRAQINPHFLYNTLNALFSQALDYSNDLADNILKLSQLMRYSFDCTKLKSGLVDVGTELDHLQILLDIHDLKSGIKRVINYTVEGIPSGQMLPPFSIITIVENAFKYGNLRDIEHPLEIKVRLEPNEIFFWIKNKKKKNITNIPSSSHIGIGNLTKRLDSLFKNNYSINVIDEDEFYTFSMHIKN